jgi:hypothetical protein
VQWPVNLLLRTASVAIRAAIVLINAAMSRPYAITLGWAALLAVAQAPPADAQSSSTLQRRLAAVATLDCSFSVLATGTWDNNTPAAKVTPAELKVEFKNINVDEGSADSDTGFGASFISVRYSQGYLHLMHMSDAGPLYLTTVLAREAGAGRLMAVHTRLEYSPTVIPGFTSRPEMYIGSCATT